MPDGYAASSAANVGGVARQFIESSDRRQANRSSHAVVIRYTSVSTALNIVRKEICEEPRNGNIPQAVNDFEVDFLCGLRKEPADDRIHSVRVHQFRIEDPRLDREMSARNCLAVFLQPKEDRVLHRMRESEELECGNRKSAVVNSDSRSGFTVSLYPVYGESSTPSAGRYS
jgi:hypothetical protein